ncbi:MAG: hypothetical protein ACJAXR_001806 [Halopseudomonas sp.]|jgi:hypothetical protein|uniref:hypothetical protein n=1 Tax=Halopseudomonas sp. TaxID=2901191 RepID=UPI0039E32AE7
MKSLVSKLLNRGDDLRIENGRLLIEPASGKEVPADWIYTHTAQLLRELSISEGFDAYLYQGYSTGHYLKNKSGGITLNFVSVRTGQSAYTIFNVDLTRIRNTSNAKAGSLLPKGQFRIKKQSLFYKFWQSTSIPFPRRLSAMHDYMGHLKEIIFIGQATGERIKKRSLRPLNLSSDRINDVFLPDKRQTSDGHLVDSIRTTVPDKDYRQPFTTRGLQTNTATGADNHGNTVTREEGITGNGLTAYKPPAEQSDEEWFDEYDRTAKL